MITTQKVKFNAIRIGDNPPLVEPVVYPTNTNIMTTQYFSTFDIKETTVSPEYDIQAGTAYVTGYNGATGTDFDHFLTGEEWGHVNSNGGESVIFKFTQPEEVAEFSAIYNDFNSPNRVIISYLDNSNNWVVLEDETPVGTSITLTTSPHTAAQTYKITQTFGSANSIVESFSVKLR